MQRAFVPDCGDGWLSLFHERQTQQGAALHGVAERLAVFVGFGNFLKFADRFFQQTHFAESDSQIVVRLKVFVFSTHFAQLGTEVVKNILQRTVFCQW